MAGGGLGVIAAAEDPGVTIGGSLIGVLGTAGMMAGVALWMMDDLTETEAKDKVRQGGVALTTVGVGGASIGGLMILSSFSDASDVDKSGRIAGIAAAGGGGALMIAGLIMYGVGGPPPDEKTDKASAWLPAFDVGPGGVRLSYQF